MANPSDLAATWLAEADVRFLQCRQRHDMPQLRPGRILPRGISISMDGGWLHIKFSCRRGCGYSRTLVTRPGELSWNARRKTKYADPAYLAPKGSDRVTPGMALNETLARCGDDLVYLATHNDEMAGVS